MQRETSLTFRQINRSDFGSNFNHRNKENISCFWGTFDSVVLCVLLCENARNFAMRRYFWIKVVFREFYIYGDIVEKNLNFLRYFPPDFKVLTISYWRCRTLFIWITKNLQENTNKNTHSKIIDFRWLSNSALRILSHNFYRATHWKVWTVFHVARKLDDKNTR
jgi:hypothetical protein